MLELMAISKNGMELQKLYAEVASKNIAMANTESVPGEEFRAELVELVGEIDGQSDVASLAQINRSSTPGKLVMRPGHPLANESGFVQLASVNYAEEMLALMKTTRAYEANTKAFANSMSMLNATMEILK